jgi:hypothetical protein
LGEGNPLRSDPAKPDIYFAAPPAEHRSVSHWSGHFKRNPRRALRAVASINTWADLAGKALMWGVIIWATYWLFQEWFIYVTLLNEPIKLATFELAILLCGSLVEGLVISRLVPAS